MSNVATLKLVGTSDLSTLTRDLKSVATESKNAASPLATMNKSLDQSTKSATSFGQKVKSLGSTFSSSVASIGTLGGSVLNLSRQYQDLSDAQIKVDQKQLKLDKTNRILTGAQKTLNGLIAKGVTGGAEYEKALNDVNIAQDGVTLATTLLGEAQEDQQRQMENFWIGLVPTVTSAGGTVMQVLKDMGGTKGFGGLKTAITSLGGKGAGLISGLLSGIGQSAAGSVGGLGAMTKGVGGLSLAMKGLALSALPVALAIGGIVLVMKPAALVIHEMVSLIKGDVVAALDSVKGMLEFFETIGPLMSAIPGGAAFSVITKLTGLKDELAKVRAEAVKTAPAIKSIDPALQALDSGAMAVSNTIDAFGANMIGLIGQTDQAAAALPQVGTGLDGIGTSATSAGIGVDSATTSLANMSSQAVITSQGMGTVTTGAVAATTGIAGLNALMNPFNANLSNTAAAAKNAGNALSQMGKQAAQAASLALQASQKTAQALNNLAKSSSMFGAGAGFDDPGRGKVGGPSVTRNPNVKYQIGGNKQTGKKGQPKGKYVTFRNGKQIGSGPGVAPPMKKKKAASGMHEMVNEPTWILAGEAGRERVDIDRPGKGGGSGTTIVNVYVDGVLQKARYNINKFQGVMK